MECHYTPDQVFDMPWTALVRLTFVADDVAEQRKKQQQDSGRPSRRLT